VPEVLPMMPRIHPFIMLEESSRFFEKKRRKKLFLCWSREVRRPMAQNKRSLFASFSSEKEVLTFLLL
jgi:hypothetical protein